MGKDKNEATHDTYQTARGPIPYNMTNDYMFRVILQKNEFVLRGLIGSLLHLDQSVIETVVITNPIKFGHKLCDSYRDIGFYTFSRDTGVLCEL